MSILHPPLSFSCIGLHTAAYLGLIAGLGSAFTRHMLSWFGLGSHRRMSAHFILYIHIHIHRNETDYTGEGKGKGSWASASIAWVEIDVRS